jgi:hypothetical protein
MSFLLQFEKNIEESIVSHFIENGIDCVRSTSIENLGSTNCQILLEYQGALETHRQIISNYHEYDLHQGNLIVQLTTFRENKISHHERMGNVRKLLLNSNNGFNNEHYEVYDLMPESVTLAQDAENNLDQTTFSYSIKWKVDISKI